MQEKEFNLTLEPWILVMQQDCTVKEVSLTDALLYAHRYTGLAGELPTQNVAVLRLMLAVLHAVFSRVDITGKDSPLRDYDDALDRWEELWKNSEFPQQPIRKYLEEQQDNFWLFHPEKPFWQLPEIKKEWATQSEPFSKLNGAISESGNKPRIFAGRCGEEKNKLTNSELARWLICMNQYDDNTLKTGLGVGLLGQFVAVTAKGKNLFETLLLNFVLLNRGNEPWTLEKASWESPVKYGTEIRKIAYPESQVAIMSYHARFGKIEKYHEKGPRYVSPKGGICYDFISKNEQMALWKKDKNDEPYPMNSLRGKQAWREFSTIVAVEKISCGLLQWHTVLQEILGTERVMCYELVEIKYDSSQHSSVENICSDSLTLHLNLLSQLGYVYRELITKEIGRCDKIAGAIGKLAGDLFVAGGGDGEKRNTPTEQAKEQYYYAIDIPFRKWLATLDARDEQDARDDRIETWRAQAEKLAVHQAQKMVNEAGTPAFIGKTITVGEKRKYYSSSMAMQWFQIEMKKIKEGTV